MKMKEQHKRFDLYYILGLVVVWIGLFLGIPELSNSIIGIPELSNSISLEWSVGIISGLLCIALYYLFE